MLEIIHLLDWPLSVGKLEENLQYLNILNQNDLLKQNFLPAPEKNNSFYFIFKKWKKGR